MPARIYFDNAATSPPDPRVVEAMLPFLGVHCGNASSLHEEGRRAREAVETARRRTAALLNADPGEIVFTGGGTEADNLALLGVFNAADAPGGHLVTSAFEHPAMLETCRALARRGVAVTRVPVGADGIVDPAEVVRAIRPDTRLVSIMAANNVAGTLQPVAALARAVREHGVLFHTDAVQAVGKVRFDLKAEPVDLLSLSAHKIHGPQGVGALYVRTGVSLTPLIRGGGQERGLRSGTENVVGAVGLGAAAEIAAGEMADEAARLVGLRDRLLAGIRAACPGARLAGHPFRRLPGHLCLVLGGLEGDAIRLLLDLDAAGVAVSSGSACSSRHAGEPPGALTAMGLDPVQARGALRITLGRQNTPEEVERFLEIFARVIRHLRPAITHSFAASERNPS